MYDGMHVDVDCSRKSFRTAGQMLTQPTLLAILRKDQSVDAALARTQPIPNEMPTLVRSKSDQRSDALPIPIVQSLFAMKLEREASEKPKPVPLAKSASNVDSVRVVVQSPSVGIVAANSAKEFAKLVLFDMEGTLGCMTKNHFRPRPGIREIALLKVKGYKVGLYTNKSARKLPRAEIEAAAGITFDVVYTGDDCKQATPSYCQLHGIDKYSRIKSLAKAGKLEELLLVDDTPAKVEPKERHRVVPIKTWDPSSKEDSELKGVVQEILGNWNDRIFQESPAPVSNPAPVEIAADASNRKRAESTGSQKSAPNAADSPVCLAPKNSAENVPLILSPSKANSNPKPPRILSAAPPSAPKAEVILTKEAKPSAAAAATTPAPSISRSGSRSDIENGAENRRSSGDNNGSNRGRAGSNSLVEKVIESKANAKLEEKPVLLLRSNYGVTAVALGTKTI